MKKWIIIAIALLLATFILSIVITYIMPKKLPRQIIQTTGIIEATEVNLSSKINEKVAQILFKEGDYVKKVDVAITLDAEKRKAEYGKAEAGLEVAKANLINAQADIEKAGLKIVDTRRDLGRMSKLLEKKLVAQNDFDKAETNYDLAVADLNKAKAQEALAGANIKESEAALVLAKSNLDDTVVVSPLSGIVTLRAFEPGEMVSAGATILTVIDTKDAWVRVDIEETEVARIKLGDTAYVSVDALPNEEFQGRVTEINSEGEFATQNDVRRGRQDIKTFRVKVKIDETKGILKSGMTAIVRFNAR